MQRDNKTGKGWLLPLGLVTLLMLTLFPFGWLGDVWPRFGRLAGWLFGSEMAHVLGHLVLFGLVGGALLGGVPWLRTHPRIYGGLMVGLGLGQEILQLISFKHHGWGGNESFDLGVDILAAVLAYCAYQVSTRNAYPGHKFPL